MSRRAARITHDEVTRMVKAVRDLGLPIGRVVFNGSELSVVIGGDSGEKTADNLDDHLGPDAFHSLEHIENILAYSGKPWPADLFATQPHSEAPCA